MIVSSKKKGSAVVEFATVRAAVSILCFPHQCPHCFFKYRHLDRSTVVYYLPLIIITNDTSQRPPSLRTVPVTQVDVFDSLLCRDLCADVND